MNKNISKLAGGLALAALSILGAGKASADTVYINGSTAFEAFADAAITNYISTRGGVILGSDNATLGSETYLLVSYTNSGGTNYINVHWTGSEGGIQGVAAPASNPATTGFVTTAITISTGLGNLIGTSYTNTANLVLASPNICFSDTYQNSSLFFGNNAASGGDHRTYVNPTTSANDKRVAVQGFAFVTCTNTFWNINNITTDEAKTLYQNGGECAYLVSGIAADTTNTVFPIGRNADSGTRVTMLNVLGLGTKGTVIQYTVDGTGTNVYQTPIQTNNGYVDPQIGSGGYSSTGGVLSTQLKSGIAAGADTSATPVHTPGKIYLIGYAGLNSSLGTAGVNVLNYNGVAGSTNTIINGTYSFWNYEHIVKSAIYTTANQSAVFTGLYNYLTGLTTAQLATHNGNVAIPDMLVSKTADSSAQTAVSFSF